MKENEVEDGTSSRPERLPRSSRNLFLNPSLSKIPWI